MASGRLRLHASVEMLSTVVGGSRYLQSPTYIGNCLALVEQLLGTAQLADDLLGGCGVCVSWGFSWPSLADREALIRAGLVFGVHVKACAD